MPNLKHLLEELEELGVEPKKIRIPGQLYDNIVADAEDSSEENAEEEEEQSSVPSMLSLASGLSLEGYNTCNAKFALIYALFNQKISRSEFNNIILDLFSQKYVKSDKNADY